MNYLAAGALVAVGGAAVLAAIRPHRGVGRVGVDPGHVLERGKLSPRPGDKLASFSGGCFWGVEDEFRQVPGVVATAVGYTGGTVPNPTYEMVCSHTTGHAETVLIEYNPKLVTYRQLLAKFWQIHDPTTLDFQGPDFGNNYRSAIWTYSRRQYREAVSSRDAEQAKLKAKVVTEIQTAMPFYLAESYHQQYDEKNGTHFCPLPNHG